MLILSYFYAKKIVQHGSIYTSYCHNIQKVENCVSKEWKQLIKDFFVPLSFYIVER